MAYFPLCVDIAGQKCVVVGGGRIAAGKVRQLLEFGASVEVIAPETVKELQELAESGRIAWKACALKEVSPSDEPEPSSDEPEPSSDEPSTDEPELSADEPSTDEPELSSDEPSTDEPELSADEPSSGEPELSADMMLPEDAALVVAATDRPGVNRCVSEWCRQRRIPVNVVDEKELCTFFFPAIARDGDVVAAVSTGGTSPALAARIRGRIEEELFGRHDDSGKLNGTAAAGERRCGDVLEGVQSEPRADCDAGRLHYGHAARVMGKWREYVKRQTPPGAVRKNVFAAMLDRALAGLDLSEEEVMRVIEEQTAMREMTASAMPGKDTGAGEQPGNESVKVLENESVKAPENDCGKSPESECRKASEKGREKVPENDRVKALENDHEKATENESMNVPDMLRIGTRGSRLALAQTELFIARVKERYPDIRCETVVIKTTGDRITDKPLAEFGGKAVFVTEFEDAIRRGEIDCAVHSAKDMPTELSEGLDIVCVLPREDVRDVLLTRAGRGIRRDEAAVIGTGSLRRQLQFLERYPDAVMRQLRGNITTRIGKLKAGDYDGIVLAAAGLKRLGLDRDGDLEYTYLPVEEMVPAGGQALIAVEGRSSGQEYLEAVTDRSARAELLAEREVLHLLHAGCHEAVGVCARLCDREIGMSGSGMMKISVMKEIDGKIHRSALSAPADEWRELAERLVNTL